ncbi:MAG: prephenate dehydratase [Propionibacteriaceae bacterium]|nr:prephenate dehydratase [Propionibacteriaceae bacterium]
MHGYFGPAGTFTHQALLSITDAEAKPYSSVVGALAGVRSGEVEAAVVPIENSVEGGVSATLDELINGSPLMIRREILVPVSFGLYARPGTALADVRHVLTHGHAAAQCRRFLSGLVDATVTEAGSTAGAAKEVARQDSRHDAAVCARVAGQMYGLEELAWQIEDNSGAVTRFVEISKAGVTSQRTGADKTTLVAFMDEDRSGALLEILEQFKVRGVNLTRIESRPTKTSLGSYCFSIDAEGHVADQRVAETLEGLSRICPRLHFLGSYPRADERAAKVDDRFSDESFTNAQRWLQSVAG